MEVILDLYSREHREYEPLIAIEEATKQLLRDLSPAFEDEELAESNASN